MEFAEGTLKGTLRALTKNVPHRLDTFLLRSVYPQRPEYLMSLCGTL